ncbi:MAG TPA: gephyrin-like molybdotransferase Glp [Gemmatimonadaceae bacterium]|nr:gephyrin-like molybdotransferase Glp [Gemmatimonadaceae bacterium]
MTVTVPEASAFILADICPLPIERVPLLDALGRVLATPVVAPLTLPPWDNSAMDGYAVRSADVEAATPEHPVVLRVLELVPAGARPTLAIGPGEATQVMTGAPVPSGADCVVRIEDTDGGDARVAVRNGRDARRNVRPRGEDIHAGQVVIPAHTPIGAAQIGVLASVGAAAVEVYRRPRVAIAGSGNEIVDLDRFHEVLAGTKIVSSNSYALHALVRSAGGVPVNLGVAADSPAAIRALLERATGCDVIITTGGVSVGAFDYTRDVLAELGAEMRFWKVRMRPGAPVGYGLLRGTPWIGLPGNPVSTMVTFELFVRPAIRLMLGHEHLFRRPIPVVLEEPVTIHADLTHFLRAIIRTREDGVVTARLTGPQGSGILTSMSLANALLVVPGERPRVEAGETLHALVLTDDAALSPTFAL